MPNIHKIKNSEKKDKYYDENSIYPIPEELECQINKVLEKYEYQGWLRYRYYLDNPLLNNNGEQKSYIALIEPSGAFKAFIMREQDYWYCMRFEKDGIGGFKEEYTIYKSEHFVNCVLYILFNNETVVMD